MTDSSEGYSEISVSSLASNDSYFSFFTVSEWNANYSGKDFASGPKEISKLLFDITGENFSVERYSGKAKDVMLSAAEKFDNDCFVIGKVGGHFINITGFSDDGKMEYFDPYIRQREKIYTRNSVTAIYLICKRSSEND